ncbi:MAG: hypothetical protein IKI58_08440 [Oscillospiraceae bacterium]|nr:hypothetical protein [Oscillospiraceae bacterium]
MSGSKKEFGDYQTPPAFCKRVCSYIINEGFSHHIEAILEPTCGIGNFLSVAVKMISKPAYGIDINPEHIRIALQKIPTASFTVENIFNIIPSEICNCKDVLVIGNPPWATNSNLSINLPKKTNFKGLRGIDALTGASNFDICEYVILQMIDSFHGTNSVICMLCKTSVARNVIVEIDRRQIPHDRIEMLNFDSHKVFGVSAAACVLIIELSSNALSSQTVCRVKDFDSMICEDTLIVNDGVLSSTNLSSFDFEGYCQMTWRSGVKHDCGKVMELELVNGQLINKNKEVVDIEGDLVFPLVKSSMFKSPVLTKFSKYVIVTQQQAKQDTGYIEHDYPMLWSYLSNHISDFKRRKSIIYQKAGAFSMFGIGDYSFAPYKVGVSGFYKKPLFSLLYSSKPVMTDDTSYFLSFDNYNDAYVVMLLLNSQPVQEYLTSIAFLDSKRPYTVKLLSKLDLIKCFKIVDLSNLERTEKQLGLSGTINETMYQHTIKKMQSS